MFINTYLYSVYGSVKAKTRKDPDLIDYRNRWLKALLVGSKVEAVVALGQAADEAWQFWRATPEGQATHVAYRAVTHPTQPESSSEGDKTKLAAATKKLLQNWNAALQILSPQVQHPDVPTPLVALWRELGRGRPGRDSRLRPPRRPARVDAPAGRLGEACGRATTSPSDATSPSLFRRGSSDMTESGAAGIRSPATRRRHDGVAARQRGSEEARAHRPARRPEAGAGGTRGHHG